MVWMCDLGECRSQSSAARSMGYPALIQGSGSVGKRRVPTLSVPIVGLILNNRDTRPESRRGNLAAGRSGVAQPKSYYHMPRFGLGIHPRKALDTIADVAQFLTKRLYGPVAPPLVVV